jgi:hypothetical protein
MEDSVLGLFVSSHDDGGPFDAKRTKTIEAGTKLLLSPGIAQVFYGDESARSLVVEGNSRRRHLTFIYELGCY